MLDLLLFLLLAKTRDILPQVPLRLLCLDMLLDACFERLICEISHWSNGEFNCSTDLDKTLASVDPMKLLVLIGDGVALHSFKLEIAGRKC